MRLWRRDTTHCARGGFVQKYDPVRNAFGQSVGAAARCYLLLLLSDRRQNANLAIPDLKNGLAGIAVAVSDFDAMEPFDGDPVHFVQPSNRLAFWLFFQKKQVSTLFPSNRTRLLSGVPRLFSTPD